MAKYLHYTQCECITLSLFCYCRINSFRGNTKTDCERLQFNGNVRHPVATRYKNPYI